MAPISFLFWMTLLSASKTVLSSTTALVTLPGDDDSSTTPGWSTTPVTSTTPASTTPDKSTTPATTTTDISETTEPYTTTTSTKLPTTLAAEASNVGFIAGTVSGVAVAAIVIVVVAICACKWFRRKMYADQYYQSVLTLHVKRKQDSLPAMPRPLTEYAATPVDVERNIVKMSSFSKSPQYANVTLETNTHNQTSENMNAGDLDTTTNQDVDDSADATAVDKTQAESTYEGLISNDTNAEDHMYNQAFVDDEQEGGADGAGLKDSAEETTHYMALQLPGTSEHIYNT